MEENNLQKKIGITLGIVVALGVLYVNIFWGKQQSSAPVAIETAQTPVVKTIPKPVSNEENNENGSPVSQSIPAPAPAPKTVQMMPPPSMMKRYVYNDGTYSVTDSYMSPAGYEQMGVSITLKSDIITAASVTNMANDGRSQRYQDRFISSYQQYVIGKNIGSLYLSTISGASLTTAGFNDAISQIKSQAAA